MTAADNPSHLDTRLELVLVLLYAIAVRVALVAAVRAPDKGKNDQYQIAARQDDIKLLLSLTSIPGSWRPSRK